MKITINWAVGNAAVCLDHGSVDVEVAGAEVLAAGWPAESQNGYEAVAEAKARPAINAAISKRACLALEDEDSDYSLHVTPCEACACGREG